jgi:preprotein translocase subunit SecA
MEEKKIAIIGKPTTEQLAYLKDNNIELIQSDEDIDIVNHFGLRSKEVKQRIEIMQMCEDLQYSHQSKSEREANIMPIRNSKNDPKHSRNELCPCGSGKKYKNCCLK